MIRDQGPDYNIGFGVRSGDLPYQEEQGPNPEGGAISRRLDDDPVLRFLATTAVTLVGMKIGGDIVKKGGLRLAYKIESSADPLARRSVEQFKHVRKHLDSYQGIKRDFVEDNIQQRLTYKDDKGIIRSGTRVNDQADGFFIRLEEIKSAKERGIEPPPMWGMKNQLQRNLVSQARRLPYELPAAYITQRALTDPIFGTNESPSERVNWYNPVDVITDFVTESTKNAVAGLAFEGGTSAVRQGWRRFLSYGDEALPARDSNETLKTASVSLRAVLARLGHDSSQLLHGATKFSAQSSGAFASAIDASKKGATSPALWAHETRKGMKHYNEQMLVQGLGRGQRSKELLRMLFSNQGPGSLLDQLPGPLKGLATGVSTFKQQYRSIGQGYDILDQMMSGAKVKLNPSELDSLYRVMPDRTDIGELASKIATYSGRNNFKGGQYYQEAFRSEYQKQLIRKLQTGYGLSDEGAQSFTKTFSIDPRKGNRTEVHLSNRLRVGNRSFHELGDTKNFYDALYSHTAIFNSAGDAQIVAKNLDRAVKGTDALFGDKAFMKDVDDRILAQWRHIEDKTIPQLGRNVLKRTRLPYEDFQGQMTDAQRSFLIRRSAEKLGIPTINPTTGTAIDDFTLGTKLDKLGLDPRSTHRLKGFLVEKGDIAKPWSVEGRNLFGLKPLEITTALDRGYFGRGEESEDIRNLLGKIRASDPVSSSVGSYSIGGVYQTTSGRIVDFASLRQKAYKFTDSVAANFQIPLVHIKPLELMGYSAWKDARQRSMLQVVPGMSNQAFLGDANQLNDSAYVWLKGNRGKGRVTRITTDQTGAVKSEFLGDGFKLTDPDPYKMAGQAARLGAGESGYAPLRGGSPPKTRLGNFVDQRFGSDVSARFKRVFNIDDRQPESIRGVFERFRNRRVDINNPTTLMRLVRDGSVATSKGTLTLAPDGSVLLDGTTYNTVGEFATAFDTATRSMRPLSFSDKAIRGASEDPRFRSLFGHTFRNLDESSGLGSGQNVHIGLKDLSSNTQIVNFARQFSKSIDDELANVSPDGQRILRRAQSSLVNRHLKAATDSGYWDELVPQGARTSTINTRADQLKADLYRLLAVREEVLRGGSFQRMLPDLMAKLDDLQLSGALNQTELTEARSALLSMQIDFLNYNAYDASVSSAANRLSTVRALQGDPNSRELIDSFLTQNFQSSTSALRDYGKSIGRRNLGFADYRYDGTEYNPFGQTDTVLVPTFGSAYNRTGMRAVGSVLGFNTWSDPEAYSAASGKVSHLFARLNRPFQTLGAGLDLSQYRGPLDMYARGLVGQRAVPIYAAGVTALAVDRTLGGMVNERDANGERVYSPLVLGEAAKLGVYAQAAGAGLMPGGMTYSERRDQLFEGEVAVRQGRYWALGNTPFLGGKIQYFRPSWYRRLTEAPHYTDETFGSPMERLAFGYDFSPLRLLDPYHYERKTSDIRPYPVSGDYFTGPWGPLNPALNATIGRFLKPSREMHPDALTAGLSTYTDIGAGGTYQSAGLGVQDTYGSGIQTSALQNVPGRFGSGASSAVVMQGSGASAAEGQNISLRAAGGTSAGVAARTTQQTIGQSNEYLIQAAGMPGSVRPEIIPAVDPISRNSFQYQASEFGYRMQEMAGIYGFAFGSAREYLGYGNQDMSPEAPVLQSSTYTFGSSRGFWDLNVGGMGDLPLPLEGDYANLEFSEVMRRFIPKERPDVNYINPILNQMGQQHPWLPGAGNITDFTRGDPYAAIQEGEMRLPGTAYERFNTLNSDEYGRYGLVDQHKILGDVAPYSDQYEEVDKLVDRADLSPAQRNRIETTRAQVAAKSKRYQFTPYEYKYSSAEEQGMSQLEFGARSLVERMQHAGTYFNTKFVNKNTAVEDWERNHIYGATFPSWSHPIQDYIEPLLQQNTQRNPIAATFGLAGVGFLFGVSPRAKGIGMTIGALTGLGASSYGGIKEWMTGERHIPESRLKEMAVEEHTDILSYVKYKRLESEAQAAGDDYMAAQFNRQSRKTMYGADLHALNPLELVQAIPKRKREHFLEMLQAPEQERERILSTAPRLERRIYQAAWGMRVEERPDLEEYFQRHELPPPTSEIWHPRTSMGDIQIKVAQSLGLDLAQMGYYPQQIAEANLINPAYPEFNRGTSEAEIRAFFRQYDIDADITPIRAPGGNGSISFYNGV